MDAFKALGDHGLNAEEPRALRSPVARTSGPILLPGNHHQRHTLALILHGRIVDAGSLAFRPIIARSVDCHTAFNARDHQVFDTHVCKRAAHHHLVITATRTIAIEVLDLYAVGLQVKARRRVWLNGAGRTDVIRSYRVAKDCEWSRSLHVTPILNCV